MPRLHHSTIYFLYPPGVTWDKEEPPDPAFWMHQLPADSGADRDLVLYPTRLAKELLTLFGDEVEPTAIRAEPTSACSSIGRVC